MSYKFITDRKILYSTWIVLLRIQKKIVWQIYVNSFRYGVGAEKINNKKTLINGYRKETAGEN